MPLNQLILILIVVIAAAGATIWLASIVLVSIGASGWIGIEFVLPMLLVGYLIWRWVSHRMMPAQGDHRGETAERLK